MGRSNQSGIVASLGKVFYTILCLVFLAGHSFGQNKTTPVSELYNQPQYHDNQPLAGLNGGNGWLNSWQGKATGMVIDKLNDQLNGVILKSGLGRQELSRTLVKAAGAPGTTIWLSFSLMSIAVNIPLGLSCRLDQHDALQVGYTGSASKLSFNDQSLAVPGSKQLHRLIIRIDFRTDGDIAYLFLDPGLSSDPDPEGATARVKGHFAFNKIALWVGSNASQSTEVAGGIGPIRLGKRFEEVALHDFAEAAPTSFKIQNLPVQSWAKSKDALLVKTAGGTLKFSPSRQTIGVQFGQESKFKATDFAVTSSPAAIRFIVKESNKILTLVTTGYFLEIEKADSRFRLYDENHHLLLEEFPDGSRNLIKGDTINPADSFHLTPDEAIYGLGQFRDGALNLRGKRRELVQVNTQVAIPVLLSTKGWGIFWDNPSRTVFEDSSAGLSFTSDLGDHTSYYLFIGRRLDDLIGDYRTLTGQAPMLPYWSLGYHQSRNRYATADELLGVARKMRQEQIPFSSIFIDYHYWGKYGTGSHHFDEVAFPDIKKTVATLHQEARVKVIATVWPTFKPGSPNYDEMNRHGYLLPGVHALDGIVYDAFNPTAAALYWKQVSTQLLPTKIDGWFLDGPEPDNVASFLTATTYAGPAPAVRNLFPLLHTTTFYQGLLKANPDQRPYIITRSAWASQQKNGTVIWSGDIGSTFEELKKQVVAGLGFSATGMPYWTTDIGGYSGGDPQNSQYREVFTRWWEYGVFCPIFRSHGRRFPGDTHGPNELWAFGPEVQTTCTTYDRFRYRLLPYIYSLTGAVTQAGYTPMRLLAFDFGDDRAALDIKDEFMYGQSILVSPVTDAGATSRQVYLPEGTNWVDFWTGKTEKGGQRIKADAPLDRIPLFVKCGSIIPLNPEGRYSDEIRTDSLELRVYPGADGKFTLYEDDGTSFDYKSGGFTQIPVNWHNETRTLDIGNRTGFFKGMPGQRSIRVIVVGPANATGFSGYMKSFMVSYSGEAVTVKCTSD